MTEVPEFFKQFQPPPEPPAADLDVQITKHQSSQGSPTRRLSFTERDWEFLDFLCEHPNATNGQLAKLFNTGLAAASARIKRLASMGLIEVAHEHSEDTGRVNKRTVSVLHVPEKPWSPGE